MRTILATVLASAALIVSSAAVADGYVVIRNAKVPVAKVSKAELRDLFTGKTKQWPNGKMVQVALGNEGSPDVQFLATSVFGVGEVALLTKIKQEAFKGEMRKPLSCTSDDECIAQVKAGDGNVALVSSAAKLPAGVAVIDLGE